MEQQALLGKYKNLSNNFSAQFSPNFDILFVVSTEMELVLRQLNVQIKEVPQVVIVLLGKCIRIQIDISMLEYKNENSIANTEIHFLLSRKWGNSEEQTVVPSLEDAPLNEDMKMYSNTIPDLFTRLLKFFDQLVLLFHIL